MELNPQEMLLYQMVKSQLSDVGTYEEAEKNVSAVGGILNLAPEMVERVLKQFQIEFKPATNSHNMPRLLVDWGELPRVGYQVRPEFNLICPAYASRPDVNVSVDRDLDHDGNDPRRRPHSDEPGLWSFHVPFRMTTLGMDCRPGHYLIQVNIAFRDVPPDMPRFYRCNIRLNVSGIATGESGVLEIDGDGQSIVNLQGYNLKQFSKVILKGGQDSVINLHNSADLFDKAVSPKAEKPSTTFEYQFKIDQEKQSKIPRLVTLPNQRAFLDTAGFYFEDGRRVIVIARPSITFGRSRDNDVILRFLPAGDENDRYSRNISRTHFISELTPEGIEVRDESKSGIEVNNSVVDKRYLVPAAWVGDVNEIKLGVTGMVSKGFQIGMVMFAPDRRESLEDREHRDELVCEVVSGRLSRLTRQALATGVDSVRYDRINNLGGEETYVHVLREAIIGGSPAQASILLKGCGSQVQARLIQMDRSFWLEPLPGCLPVTIDGNRIPPLSLVALSPGMELRFGEESVRFDRKAQWFIDPLPT